VRAAAVRSRQRAPPWTDCAFGRVPYTLKTKFITTLSGHNLPLVVFMFEWIGPAILTFLPAFINYLIRLFEREFLWSFRIFLGTNVRAQKSAQLLLQRVITNSNVRSTLIQ
jgi:hypothetical protein